MTNSQIADVLDQMADLLELQEANAFRVRGYRNGARAVRELGESVEAIVDEDWKQLIKFDGIGKGVAEKCKTLVETGQLPQLAELLEKTPATVLEIVRIPGLGPKKAGVLHRELGIETLDELRAACSAGTVRQLKGFGEKTEQTILAGIGLAANFGKRIFWSQADSIAQQIKQHLSTCPSIEQLEIAGSYRRGKETVGDLDVLVVSRDVEEVMDQFGTFAEVANVIVRGSTKMSVRLQQGLQIDLRVVPARSFGAALQYFTGSKEHNVVLRGMAKQRGLKINEYGVYRVDNGQEYVAGETESDVYAMLDLPVFAPELREGRKEFDWAEDDNLPELIRLADIRGDLHMHTTETDGQATLAEMVDAARQNGLSYIAITDHSQRVAMSMGLDETRLRKQWEAIDRLNEELGKAFTVLKGIECDILEAGGMDLPDEVLADADWVLGSIHYGQNQPRDELTKRITDALANPHVNAVAHPTGRILNKRDSYDVDMDAIFAAAKRHGKLLELNAHPARLDLDDLNCAAAKSHGIPIVISSDAHSTKGLDVLKYGIKQARRAGLTKQDVANSRTWTQLRKLIGK